MQFALYRDRYKLRAQIEDLGQKFMLLDEQELEILERRTIFLKKMLEAQKASGETDSIGDSPQDAIDPASLPADGGLLSLHGSRTVNEEPLEDTECDEDIIDPSTKQAETLPSADVAQQDTHQRIEVDDTSDSVPPQDDSVSSTIRHTKMTGPSRMKTKPDTHSSVLFESLSAEKDATNEEMSQIKRAKEALHSRERELEAQSKERKKGIQELNAPKSEPMWPTLSGAILGSALSAGVMMIISANRG